MTDRLVTIATYSSPMEAALARNRWKPRAFVSLARGDATLFGGLVRAGSSRIQADVPRSNAMRAEDILVALEQSEANRRRSFRRPHITEEPPRVELGGRDGRSRGVIHDRLPTAPASQGEEALTAKSPAPESRAERPADRMSTRPGRNS